MTNGAGSNGGLGGLAKQAANTPLVTTSLLGLFLVSIKILSVVKWNASSALAILSTSDTVALLGASLLSLIPAFVAFLIAGCTLWWATSIRARPSGRPVIRPHWALLRPPTTMRSQASPCAGSLATTGEPSWGISGTTRFLILALWWGRSATESLYDMWRPSAWTGTSGRSGSINSRLPGKVARMETRQ